MHTGVVSALTLNREELLVLEYLDRVESNVLPLLLVVIVVRDALSILDTAARLHRADAKQDLLPRPMFVSSSAVIAGRGWSEL